MSHNQTDEFPVDWTEYDSSYGIGWEPMESQWTFNGQPDVRINYKKQARMSSEFPVNWMTQYMETVDFQTACVFFNLSNPDIYQKWTSDCREWFAKNHSDVQLVFVGHVMYLETLKHPSRYSIKEGYILDTTEYNLSRENLSGHKQNFQIWLKTKQQARGTNLYEVYKQSKFDYVFNLSELEHLDGCRQAIGKLVSVPDNLEELFNRYMELNKPDTELDELLFKIMLDK
jgi:hypothetical protein